jgi:hypothetical protein
MFGADRGKSRGSGGGGNEKFLKMRKLLIVFNSKDIKLSS